jgi:hypothetical protein
MKNKLLITTFKNGEGSIMYKVYEYGTGTVYMVTKNKVLAEELVLKLKFNKERQNASQV